MPVWLIIAVTTFYVNGGVKVVHWSGGLRLKYRIGITLDQLTMTMMS